MKFFITGACGQLGHMLVSELKRRKYDVTASDLQDLNEESLKDAGLENIPYVRLDITNLNETEEVLRKIMPDHLIHCAAWTAVDAAEEPENIEKVRAINVNGTENLAKACKEIGCVMTYISTDYVFNGQGEKPWKPDDKNYEPLSVYGQSKLDGELAIVNTINTYFIIRIAWLFGLYGNNFVRTMLNVGKTHDEVKVVCDQIGTPTYTQDLARLIVDINETDKYGYYNATNEGGYISWYDFTKEIYQQATELGLYDYSKVNVVPVTTKEYGLSKAKRPFNSRLDKAKLVESGFKPLPEWKDAVNRYLKELKDESN